MRLGEWLVAQGYLTSTQLDDALSAQQASEAGTRLGEILQRLQLVEEHIVLAGLGEQFHIEVHSEIEEGQLDRSLVRDLPVDFLRSRPMIPVRHESRVLLCSPDPTAWMEHNELSVLLGDDVEPVLTPDRVVREAIDRVYARRETGETPVQAPAAPAVAGAKQDSSRQDLLRTSEESPVAGRVSRLLLEALDARASDVHLDPRNEGLAIRLRIDGVLQPWGAIDAEMEDAFVSRIKIMAGLDIAERRLPQDGNAKVRVGAKDVDVRVSSIPVSGRERLVLRLLGRDATRLSLKELGMSDQVLAGFRSSLALPYGVIWVTGPTGAGKTTTLYGALQELDTRRRNVLTIEEPVEYQLDNIGQMNVVPQIGLTFAAGLRHILRQDPDVILVGETRDEETAEIVVRASMTGHLVFSTLHANDATSAAMRVVDMGVEPYLVAEATQGALAQRLVRTLCGACCSKAEFQGVLPRELADLQGELPVAVGCEQCVEGMKGRIGLFEFLMLNETLRDGIRSQSAVSNLRAIAKDSGFLDVWADARLKVESGLTTVEEVLAVLGKGS